MGRERWQAGCRRPWRCPACIGRGDGRRGLELPGRRRAGGPRCRGARGVPRGRRRPDDCRRLGVCHEGGQFVWQHPHARPARAGGACAEDRHCAGHGRCERALLQPTGRKPAGVACDLLGRCRRPLRALCLGRPAPTCDGRPCWPSPRQPCSFCPAPPAEPCRHRVEFHEAYYPARCLCRWQSGSAWALQLRAHVPAVGEQRAAAASGRRVACLRSRHLMAWHSAPHAVRGCFHSW
mmetsp:Transcript_62336/g.177042  ORF Transcript_62336/g.177042 Transcript_62336/m.177042 type:complete len:236 (-) Transcript_62336:28-735(-)